MDPVEAQSIDEYWGYRYGVKLTPDERVGKPLMKKLHIMWHASPPEVEIITLEQITLYSVTTKSVDQFVRDKHNAVQVQQKRSLLD